MVTAIEVCCCWQGIIATAHFHYSLGWIIEYFLYGSENTIHAYRRLWPPYVSLSVVLFDEVIDNKRYEVRITNEMNRIHCENECVEIGHNLAWSYSRRLFSVFNQIETHTHCIKPYPAHILETFKSIAICMDPPPNTLDNTQTYSPPSRRIGSL